MKFLTSFLLVLLALPSEAQKIKTKTEKTRYYKEIYQIDKATKIKEKPGVFVLNTHFLGIRRAVPANK